jgi:cation transport ATPase
MFAGAAMALSSISVVISSLMLRIYTPFEVNQAKRKAHFSKK